MTEPCCLDYPSDMANATNSPQTNPVAAADAPLCSYIVRSHTRTRDWSRTSYDECCATATHREVRVEADAENQHLCAKHAQAVATMHPHQPKPVKLHIARRAAFCDGWAQVTMAVRNVARRAVAA